MSKTKCTRRAWGASPTVIAAALAVLLLWSASLAFSQGQFQGKLFTNSSTDDVLAVVIEGFDTTQQAHSALESVSREHDEATRLDRQAKQWLQLQADAGIGGRADELYIEIVYGTPTGSLILDGEEYGPEDIMAMSNDERRDLALALFAQEGALDSWERLLDEQAEFLAHPAHREYAGYHYWMLAALAHQGGVEQYWNDTAESNPNADAYLDSLDDDLNPNEQFIALTGTLAFRVVHQDFYLETQIRSLLQSASGATSSTLPPPGLNFRDVHWISDDLALELGVNSGLSLVVEVQRKPAHLFFLADGTDSVLVILVGEELSERRLIRFMGAVVAVGYDALPPQGFAIDPTNP